MSHLEETSADVERREIAAQLVDMVRQSDSMSRLSAKLVGRRPAYPESVLGDLAHRIAEEPDLTTRTRCAVAFAGKFFGVTLYYVP